MSTNAITIKNFQSAARPWTETLHEWVTTVDHKRLGILYILYALCFLVIAGIEVLIIRVQLIHGIDGFSRTYMPVAPPPSLGSRAATS